MISKGRFFGVSFLSFAIMAQLLFVFSSVAFSGEAPAGGDWEDLVSSEIPETFPQFVVPGKEKDMALLRDLLYLHYPKAGVGSALWHAWMPDASSWIGVADNSRLNPMANEWAKKLSDHFIDSQGYVASDMGQNFGHSLGWPFPHWTQADGAGWHFSLSNQPDLSIFGLFVEKDTKLWQLDGIKNKGLEEKDGWILEIEKAGATITTPPIDVKKEAAPFLRITCKAENYNSRANPFVEWTTKEHKEFSSNRRAYFTLGETLEHAFHNEGKGMLNVMIPLYKLPGWEGEFTSFRVNFGDNVGAKISIRSIITAVDTRHNVNNFTFVKGCSDYVGWTGDLSFLRKNIQRIRLALNWGLKEFEVEKYKCVHTPWIGHDGRSGFEVLPDGTKKQIKGRGIGNAYFDLLPFGGKDALTTIYCYDAIIKMASLEKQIAANPQWNIPSGPLAFDPEKLTKLAQQMKKAGKQFWNSKTGRFISAIDVDGKKYDYGLTFVSLEAIHYGFATDKQAKIIMDWITGKRIVKGDTSQGKDIYHWRFAPRCTTKRNVEYYGFVWTAPEAIPFGGQVQDGGAVLGFSYHDLMSRIAVYGADNAAERLGEILAWYGDVCEAGGYRKYYENIPGATLQGGGTAGGLGLDCEFIENILVPQIMLHGFMGIEQRADGIKITPNLPSDWPSITLTRIDFHSMICDISVTEKTIKVACESGLRSFNLYVPAGKWSVKYCDAAGKEITKEIVKIKTCENFVSVENVEAVSVEFIKND